MHKTFVFEHQTMSSFNNNFNDVHNYVIYIIIKSRTHNHHNNNNKNFKFDKVVEIYLKMLNYINRQ